MSKLISIDCITELRKKIISDNNYISKDDFEKTDFFNVDNFDLIDAPEFPDLDADFIKDFKSAFHSDSDNEFELAKIIYEGIRIPRYLAANNQFWIYVNFRYFKDYILQRWVEKKDGTIEQNNYVKNVDNFFLKLESSQNSLIKSPIAGLWWAIELSLNNKGEKYYYSKIFLSDRNLRDKNLGTYKFIRHKDVFLAVLDFFHHNKNSKLYDENLGSEAIAQQMSKTLNQVGGLTVLSFLEFDEILNLLHDNKELILKRAKIVKDNKKKSAAKVKNEKEFKQKNNFAKPNTDTNKAYYTNINIEPTISISKNKDFDLSSNFFITEIGNIYYEFNEIPTNEKVIFNSKVKYNNSTYLFLGYENGNIVKFYMSVFERKTRNFIPQGVNMNGLKFIHYSLQDIDIVILSESGKCILYNTVNISNPIRTRSGSGNAKGVNVLNLTFKDKAKTFKLLSETNFSDESQSYFRRESRAKGSYIRRNDSF